jgi:glutathione S-transferase
VYDLHIANKNYSSWSARPWVLMTELGIPFREQLSRFADDPSQHGFRAFSPTGKVPCLIDGDTVVWDSLAIAEYLAERHAGVWPTDARARAWARCAAAEMHSGFGTLREVCSMSCGVRIKLHAVPDALARDVARITELWTDGLRRHGGPFLAGTAFTAVDAFFCPVAFRVQTYGLEVDPASSEYVRRLLALPSMQRWYTEALAETFRDVPHEVHTPNYGKVVEDLRAKL